MRCLSLITAGVVTSALGIAACSGGEAFTAPDQSPSFSSLSVGTQYVVSLTCNAPAINSLYHIVLYQGTVEVGRITNNCRNLVVTPAFDNFTYNIQVYNSASEILRECTERRAPVTRTGKFACKRDGLSAVLNVQPQ